MTIEENNNPEQLLNKYFDAAKTEPTIISAHEIENLISSHETNKISENTLARYKYWLAGGLGIIFCFVLFVATRNNVVVEPNATETVEKQIAKEKTSPTIADENGSNQSQENAIRPRENIKVANDSSTKKEISIVEKESTTPHSASKPHTKKDTFYFQGDANINFEFEGDDVKMVIGSSLKKLEINGEAISENDFTKYEKIITQGMALKHESDKRLTLKNDAETIAQQKNKEVMNALIIKLQNDGWIDTATHFEFRLTGTQLFIGNEQKTADDFARYKTYYENISGNKLNVKSNIKIKH